MKSSGAEARSTFAIFCLAHFLSTWGDRTWSFAAALLLIDVWPASLLAVAAYGLVSNLGRTALSSTIGGWLDRTPRMKSILIVLVLENVGIAVSCAILSYMLFRGIEVGLHDGPGVALVATVLVFGAAADAAQVGEKIALEKDWVVVLAEGDKSRLAQMNSTMKVIDLVCKITAPLLVGAVMTLVGNASAAVYVGAAALVFVACEFLLLRVVAARCPSIEAPRRRFAAPAPASSGPSQTGTTDHASYGAIDGEAAAGDAAALAPKPGLDADEGGFLAHLRIYFTQPDWPSALALGVIYFTVLDLGALMTAYLNLRGLSALALGAARGAGAVLGVSASAAFPALRACVGPRPLALAAIWLQLLCISPALTAVRWPFPNPAPAHAVSLLMCAAVASSRFGLWTFDLSASQMMQESVPEHQRGAVGGVQNTLQNGFQMLAFILGVAFHNPNQFPGLVVASVGVIAAAAMLVTADVALACRTPRRRPNASLLRAVDA